MLLLNTSNCSMSVEVKEKCYKELFENSPTKIVVILFSVIFTSFNIILPYGVVWYERFGTDNKRTLMNKLVSNVCWTLIQFVLICQTGDIIRYTIGPFPVYLCTIFQVVRTAMKVQLLLILDIMQITRYIFIFKLKNPSAVHDDFWSSFINLWVFGYGLASSFVTFFVNGRKPLMYYICADMDMTSSMNYSQRTYGVTEVFSLFVHVVIQARIWHYKATLKQKEPKALIGSKQNNNSLSNFTTNLISILGFCVFVFLTMKANSMTNLDVKEFPNSLFMQIFQLIAINMFGLTLSVVYYIKHKIMAKAIYLSVKEFILLKLKM
jgi:hypothetical protein